MAGRRQSVIVRVYRDDTKEELLVGIPVIDLGVSTGGEMKATRDEGLIQIAKHQVRNTMKEDAESLYYEVWRARSKPSRSL